jgi:hypothetical protein
MQSERCCPSPPTFTLARSMQRKPTHQQPTSMTSQRQRAVANAPTLPLIPPPMHYPQHPTNADKRKPSNTSKASNASQATQSKPSKASLSATAPAPLPMHLHHQRRCHCNRHRQLHCDCHRRCQHHCLCPCPHQRNATALANANATATLQLCHHHATTTTLTLATTTTTKVKGNVWVNGKCLVAAGEDGWWRQYSLFIRLIVPQKNWWLQPPNLENGHTELGIFLGVIFNWLFW